MTFSFEYAQARHPVCGSADFCVTDASACYSVCYKSAPRRQLSDGHASAGPWGDVGVLLAPKTGVALARSPYSHGGKRCGSDRRLPSEILSSDFTAEIFAFETGQ